MRIIAAPVTVSHGDAAQRRLLRDLIKRRSNARKAAESAKFFHTRERAKGRLSEIENTLLAIGYTEAASCK